MALGRRCDSGCASWPPDAEFVQCPQCGEATEVYNNLQPLEYAEAMQRKAELEFEAFYEAWCDEWGQGTDGPLSDATEARLSAASGTDVQAT